MVEFPAFDGNHVWHTSQNKKKTTKKYLSLAISKDHFTTIGLLNFPPKKGKS